MISKEQYEDALKLVQDYAEQTYPKYVTNRVCCSCKKNVVTKIDHKSVHPLRQEQSMWKDGVVEKITFGYGSKHDMESYYIAICDSCIDELETNGLASNIRDIKKGLKV